MAVPGHFAMAVPGHFAMAVPPSGALCATALRRFTPFYISNADFYTLEENIPRSLIHIL
jgi:hypothetical protein